jgi:hypothetical protein
MVKIIPEIQILAHILKHLKNGTQKNRNVKVNSEEKPKIKNTNAGQGKCTCPISSPAQVFSR